MVFYRVYQKGGTNQTALVLLNKGNQTTRISVSDYLEPGEWRDAFTGGKQRVRDRLEVDVPIASAYSCWDQAPDPRRHPQAPGRTEGSQQPVRAAVRIRAKTHRLMIQPQIASGRLRSGENGTSLEGLEEIIWHY